MNVCFDDSPLNLWISDANALHIYWLDAPIITSNCLTIRYKILSWKLCKLTKNEIGYGTSDSLRLISIDPSHFLHQHNNDNNWEDYISNWTSSSPVAKFSNLTVHPICSTVDGNHYHIKTQLKSLSKCARWTLF